MRKISVITPCYNAEKYILETFESVVTQTAITSKKLELEYIICDGHSSDETLEILKKLKSRYSDFNIIIISEKDKGMYDALAKGLIKASGDYCAYINAGDFYSKTAFDVVLELFNDSKINWLTGFNVMYNENSQMVYCVLPFKYSSRLIRRGLYNGKILPFIQQESTFWRTSLNKNINFGKLSSYKFAGDYFIWNEFAKITNLYIVESYLGGFKVHRGQLSENLSKYLEEVRAISQNPHLVDYFQAIYYRFMWQMPPIIKKIFNNNRLFRFDFASQQWH